MNYQRQRNPRARKSARRSKKKKAASKDQTSLIPRKYQNAMWDIASRAAWKGVNYMICNKFIDRDFEDDFGTINTTGDFIRINNIELGDETNQREGKSIHMKSLYLRYTVQRDVQLNEVTNNRVIVVRQKGSVNTTTVATFTTDLFETDAGFTGSSIYAPIDHTGFEIMYDQNIDLVPENDSEVQHFSTTIPLNNMKVSYVENTAVPFNNGLFIFMVGSEMAPDVDKFPPTVKGFARLLYTDG